MQAQQWQADQFEQHRRHLRVAYRILGSGAEADDAVQEAWFRVSRSDLDAVQNMRGWLTTIVSRICLDMLRTRRARREDLVDDWPPDRETVFELAEDPEHEALMADAVGLALLVVLETLSPAERLAFVLHDMFAMPFEEIAPIVERNVAATRQLASRARRRVQGAEQPEVVDSLVAQRRVVNAFLAASREGDFEALLEVLDPDVVFRADRGPLAGPPVLVGARAVAETILERGSRFARFARPAIFGSHAGVVVPAGPNRVALRFTISGSRIQALDLVLYAPDR